MLVRNFSSIIDINKELYCSFLKDINGSIFYDYNFLLALEENPLLPNLSYYYIVIFDCNSIVGFLPAYLQVDVDPFGVLSDSLGYKLERESRAIFSHVMHVSDSNILTRQLNSNIITEVLINELDRLSKVNDVLSYGMINITNINIEKLLPYSSGWDCNFMWNRFGLDLQSFNDVEDIIQNLSGRSRREVNRQIRIYSESNGEIRWLHVKDADLEQVTSLCEKTTIKNGTPNYYPKKSVANLLKRCSDFTRIVEIRQNGLLAGVCIIFLDGDKIHLWAGGMDYEVADFSPYTLLFLDVYRYSLDNNIRFIEAGRTNQKVKERLGLIPTPLYSITKKGNESV